MSHAFRTASVQLTSMRNIGFRHWANALAQKHFVAPAKELELRQVVVSVSVGFWGGLCPIPCTSAFTAASIMMYSWGAPKHQRFNAPMASIAIVVNELLLPVNLAALPGFVLVGASYYEYITGQEIDCRITKQVMQDLHEKPKETLERCGFCFGLGCAVWTAMTPLVLGYIRVVARASKFAH